MSASSISAVEAPYQESYRLFASILLDERTGPEPPEVARRRVDPSVGASASVRFHDGGPSQWKASAVAHDEALTTDHVSKPRDSFDYWG